MKKSRPLSTLMTLLMVMGLSLTAGTVQAETIQRLPGNSDEQGGVISHFSNQEMERFLDDYTGGNYEDRGDGAYRFQMLGCDVMVFNNGINMQLYSGYVMDSVSYRAINEWNAGKRFSRAYLDLDEDPILESDLDLEGGSSVGAVKEFFRTYELSLSAFTKHIGWQECGQ